jgi:clostripain
MSPNRARPVLSVALAIGAAILPALAQESRPAPGWTFMVYAAVDNDAEEDGNFFAFLDGVRAAFADDPGMEIVLFIDRSTKYSSNATSLGEDFADTRLYRVRSGACTPLDGGAEFPEIGLAKSFEADSADPVNVGKFIAFSKARFPAKRYGLLLYGHADGRAMCPDEQSGAEMGFAQLTDVVPEAQSVDLMGLELCHMGGVEVAYQWRPGTGRFCAKTLVAIPNAGPAMDWARVFRCVRSGGTPAPDGATRVDPATMSDREFGALIVAEGGAGRRAMKQEHEAVASYDLSKAAAVKTAVDAWAVALAESNTKETLEELRGPGPEGFALNYSRDRIRGAPFIDLHDLATRAAACQRLDEKTRAASRSVAASVDDLVVASFGGEKLPRFREGASGIWIIFPDGDAVIERGPQSGARFWSMCRFYSPLPVRGVYGRLAWCKDGALAGNGKVENWFELLDKWFDDTSANALGSNAYAP